MPWSHVNVRRRLSGSVLIFAGERWGDLVGLVAVGEVHQQRVAGAALHERPDRGLVVLADDQVSFPVARDRAVISLLGALGDIDHVRDPVAALAGLAAGLRSVSAGRRSAPA